MRNSLRSYAPYILSFLLCSMAFIVSASQKESLDIGESYDFTVSVEK